MPECGGILFPHKNAPAVNSPWLVQRPLTSGSLVRVLHDTEGATDITYVKRRGDVRFQVESDFKAVGDFYAKKLAEQGWTKSAKQNLQRSFWVQSFSKDGVSLEVRVDTRAQLEDSPNDFNLRGITKH